MLTSKDGVKALSDIRRELEEDAEIQFPDAVQRELLVLYDVCKALGFSNQATEEVLGESGRQHVHDLLNVPVELLKHN